MVVMGQTRRPAQRCNQSCWQWHQWECLQLRGGVKILWYLAVHSVLQLITHQWLRHNWAFFDAYYHYNIAWVIKQFITDTNKMLITEIDHTKSVRLYPHSFRHWSLLILCRDSCCWMYVAMVWSAYHCVHGTSCWCTLSASAVIEPSHT